MAYCTKTDLQRIVRSDDITSLSQASDANITSAIADADALIDVKLGGVYITPLSSTDTIITRISAQLAIYYLYSTYLNLAHFEDGGAYRKFYTDSIKLLDELRQQKIALPNASLLDGASDATIVVKSTSTKKFSDTTLDKW